MTTMTRRQILATAGAAGVAAVTAGALAGCDSDDSEGTGDLSGKRAGAMDDYGVGKQFKATEALTFPIMLLSNQAYPYKKEWLFFSELTSRTNVTLEPTVIPGSDYNQKRSVMISGGDAPLIIPKTYHPDEEQYIASGAILPVSDYIDYMPNFKDKIAKWNLGGDLDQWRQEDGKFYLLPGVHEDVWIDYSVAVRTDILTKLNLSVPKTWDDLTGVLRKMREAYPNNYPFSDRWSTPPLPGANNLLSIVSQNYGAWAGWAWLPTTWDAATSKFQFSGATESYKQTLTYLNGLVKEKLLDPESFTQTDDAARQKFATGKSFVISCNAQTLVNEARLDIAKIPGATVIKIPQPMGPLGAVKQGTRLENGIMISSKAKDSKNFVALLQFIDWLWYSDEGQMFAKWGVQGTTYTGSYATNDFKLNSDITWAGINPGAPKSLQVEYGFANGVFAYGGSTVHLESQFSDEEKEFQKVMTARRTLEQPPPHPLNADEREQASLWETGLKDHTFQNTLKFILGQRPLSDWDAYVAELKAKNMDQYVTMVNGAYERYKKAHG
jgi:putative aldouronate transport system substrate-binding protein